MKKPPTKAPAVPPVIVAKAYPLRPFVFPGEHVPPPIALPLPALGELVRELAAMIERPRFEGMAEVWAGALAEKLLAWLAGRAAEGSQAAQGELVDLAAQAVDLHTWSLHQGHEGPLLAARRRATMPGRVSLNPEVTADWQAFLERICQGSETPVPMKRGPSQKRSKRDVYGANHLLVASLWQYMEGYRNNGIAKTVGIPSDHPEIPLRVREILALKPLSLEGETWKAWHKVGRKIVWEAAGGNPASHPAFQRPPLSSLISRRTPNSPDKDPLARELHTAWRALAAAQGSPETG